VSNTSKTRVKEKKNREKVSEGRRKLEIVSMDDQAESRVRDRVPRAVGGGGEASRGKTKSSGFREKEGRSLML